MADAPDLNYAIIRVARAHRHLAGALFADLGLHPGQEVVLQQLWIRDGRTSTELAAGARVEPGTMSRTLASLERAGYLLRTTSTADRRAVNVTLTELGRGLQPRVEDAWRQLAERTTAGLDPQERATLLELLDRIAQNLSRH